jgi:hypothetical protein
MQPYHAEPTSSAVRQHASAQQITYNSQHHDNPLRMVNPDPPAPRCPTFREVSAKYGEPHAKPCTRLVSQHLHLVQTEQCETQYRRWADKLQSERVDLLTTASDYFEEGYKNVELHPGSFDKSATIHGLRYSDEKRAGYVTVESHRFCMYSVAEQTTRIRSGSPGPRSEIRQSFWGFLTLRR